MTDHKPDRVELRSIMLYSTYEGRDLINSLVLVAIGFVTTCGALEAAWRMGKMIGKRGEKTIAWRLT